MKYCNQCGQQLADETMFCAYCGAPQGAPAGGGQAAPSYPEMQYQQQAGPQMNPQQAGPQGYQQMNGQPGYQQMGGQPGYPQMGGQYAQPGQFKEKLSGIINSITTKVPKKVLIAVPVAIVVIIILISILTGMRGAGSYKNAAKNLYNGLAKGNYKKVIAATMPSGMERAYNKAIKKGTCTLNYDSVKEAVTDRYDYYLYDGGMEIRNVTISSKNRYSASQLRDMKRDWADALGKKIEVKEAYDIVVKYQRREKGTSRWDRDLTDGFIAYKVGSKWYLIPYTLEPTPY